MSRFVQRLVLLVVVALVGATLVASPASAAPTWQPVADLSQIGNNADNPAIAVDAAGNATAVWRRYNGSHYIVQASTRPAGGTWAAPADLSVPGQSADEQQVAVDAAGNATAVWLRFDGTVNIVQSATRPAGGNWTTPVTLSAPLGEAYELQLAVDAAGIATAIWDRYNGSNYIVQTATRLPGATWGSPVSLSAAGQDAEYPQIAFDAGGNATAVWRRSNGVNDIIQSATRPAGGVWGDLANLSASGQDAGNPQVGLDAAGNATAVWIRYDGANDVAQAATRPAGGTWTTPVTLSAPGQYAYEVQVVVAGAGTATAIWDRDDGANYIVQAATRTPGGSWSPAVNVSALGQNGEYPQVAVDAAGNVTAVWRGNSGGNDVIQSATRPTGGVWGGVATLSASGQNADVPQVAVDPAGNAAVVWERYNGSNDIIQARGLDVAGPVITSFAAPATGTAGQSLAYSVGGYDVWSTIASIGWNFGDGTTATGASINHTFAAAGARTVTVTLTDAVGNVTTRTAGTTIAAAVPPVVTPPAAAPVITKLKLKPGKIRGVASKSRAKKKAKVTVGLTSAAKVTMVFKAKGGKKKAGKKIKLVKNLRAGTSTFKLAAKVSRKKILRPGRYTIIVRASNGAGTSPARKLTLRVVR